MSYPLDLHKIPRSLSEESSLFSGQEAFGSSFHLLFKPLHFFSDGSVWPLKTHFLTCLLWLECLVFCAQRDMPTGSIFFFSQ